jgi:hypothetical protein
MLSFVIIMTGISVCEGGDPARGVLVSRVKRALGAILLGLALGAGGQAQADTLWTGPEVDFTQSSTNLTDVLIPGAVSLTRDYSQWLFNPAAGDTGPGAGTPTDTEWAFGTIDNYLALDYQTFDSYRDGDLADLLVGNPMVVHLINEDIYLSLTFSAWPQHGGFFAYTRSTAGAVAPTVTMTNPASGAVFAAPARVQLGAAAAVAGGAVTNVAFYSNGNSVGAVPAAPFVITVGGLAAGAYALTAVATAGGISATSAAVDISVVSPVGIRLTSPSLTNGVFAFDYAANPGLGYVIQRSSNLVNWEALATNVAAGSLVGFTDSFVAGGFRYYRVGRLANP